MQVLIVWATLGKRKLNFMALFYRALYLLLFGHVQYPGDFGCVSLKFGAAHYSTATFGKKVPTPKSIDPETENRSLHVVFRSHHCTWRAEQCKDFGGGVAKQQYQYS